MTKKLLTVEELIKEFEKLPKNTVVNVEYDEWLHNHPIGKFKFILSFEDAKTLLGDVE